MRPPHRDGAVAVIFLALAQAAKAELEIAVTGVLVPRGVAALC
jgi:hypothetical protein